ncbi:hypothetical protein MNB_SV-15-662 [hydrothermal vent metagenome]|uniref:Uncharacterized protein n=1 Tax=hydrothermal vent metagenome TaxID=652676 RepID=A0A1W1EHR8_9ZZZZ
MNSNSINFEYFIDCDSNPFIIFNNSAKVVYLNSIAQILLGYVNTKELYHIATSYAPSTYGSKTTTIELKYGSFVFHSINIAYQDEENIAIRLYNKPIITQNISKGSLRESDINVILEANLSLFKIYNSDVKIELFTDIGMPKFKMEQNQLSKLIRDSLNAFKNNQSIFISLHILVGEYIVIENKRYKVLQIEIKSENIDKSLNSNIKKLSQKNYIMTLIKSNSIEINIPVL